MNSYTAGSSRRVAVQLTCDSPPDFDEMVRDNRPYVFRFLLASSRDVDLAETLTQECFLKAYRNWPNFRGESSAKTWIMRIAINLQKDHWRNRQIQFWRQVHSNAVDPNEAADWLTVENSSPETALLARERVARVWKIVEQLTGKQQTVFLLRFIDELGMNEIAEATGLHIGTVKAHLSRALAKIRQKVHSE